MNNKNVAIPRVFNDAVQKAKNYKTESLNQVGGQYTSDGWSRKSYDEINTSTIFTDKNHDHWVDEVVVKKDGQITIEAKNTNPYTDSYFDLYKEYKDGKLSKVVEDRDKNGKYDIVSIYDKGKLSQTIEDITNDGKPELYTFYNKDGSIAEQIDTRSGWEKFLDSILKK